MPIAATFPALKAQIKNALVLDRAATPDSKAVTIAAAIASVAPSGFFPPSPPVPLVPTGVSGAQSQTKNAVNLQQSASPEQLAKTMTAAIMIICPTVPPAGQALLELQLTNAHKMDVAATPDTVATIMASAIITYFSTGGVV